MKQPHGLVLAIWPPAGLEGMEVLVGNPELAHPGVLMARALQEILSQTRVFPAQVLVCVTDIW